MDSSRRPLQRSKGRSVFIVLVIEINCPFDQVFEDEDEDENDENGFRAGLTVEKRTKTMTGHAKRQRLVRATP